ncbi:hypothetical protein MTO96_013602 [Rhipicephalus appendiculatus]
MMVSHSVIGMRNAAQRARTQRIRCRSHELFGRPCARVTTTGRKRSAAAEAAVGGCGGQARSSDSAACRML